MASAPKRNSASVMELTQRDYRVLYEVPDAVGFSECGSRCAQTGPGTTPLRRLTLLIDHVNRIVALERITGLSRE